MRITNYSELSNNLKGFFDGVIDNCEPLMVHQEGDKSVVVLSLEEYNAIQETASYHSYCLSDIETIEMIKNKQQ